MLLVRMCRAGIGRAEWHRDLEPKVAELNDEPEVRFRPFVFPAQQDYVARLITESLHTRRERKSDRKFRELLFAPASHPVDRPMALTQLLLGAHRARKLD